MLCTNIKVGLLYEKMHLPARFSLAFSQIDKSLPRIYAFLYIVAAPHCFDLFFIASSTSNSV